MRSRICLWTAAAIAVLAPTSMDVVTRAAPAPAMAPSRPAAAQRPSIHVPLYFEENVGQADAAVRFVAHANGYRSLLTPTGNVMVFSAGDRRDAIDMRFIGAKAAAGQALEPLRSFSAYFRGNDPKQWRTHVSHYAKVRYPNIYEGIDLVYYGRGRDLEYDFIVRPGADPAQIRVAFRGAKTSTLTEAGDLRLETTLGEVRQRKPYVYQVIDGAKKEVGAAQRIDGDTIAFSIEAYDRSRDLIVDPILEWSTYLGGGSSSSVNSASDKIEAISVSADKSIYVAGATASPDFPVLNPLDDTVRLFDAFVSKFVQDPALGAPTLAWSTYLGAGASERVSGLAIRPGGAVYLVGSTDSFDFPTLFPFQPYRPVFDAFVTRLQETGDQLSLVWSTFLGGNGDNFGQAIDVDADNNVYVTGRTRSQSFPLVNAFQGDQPGDDVFVTKFNAFTGTNLTAAYSTYLGGNGSREIPTRLRVDSSGAAYVVGETNSSDFPTVNALPIQPTFRTGFITKLRAGPVPAVTLEWSTLLGGGNFDTVVNGIDVDAGGAVFVAGQTDSPTFPVINGYQAHQGSIDAFLARIDQTSPLTLAWSTYYGGSEPDIATDIALDRSGGIYIAGHTQSFDLPLFNPTQQLQGFDDAFVARFVVGPGGGPDLVGATLVGGTRSDGVEAIGPGDVALALDADAGIYLAGTTNSQDFPVLNEYSGYRGGRDDGFITKLRNDPIGITVTSSSAGLAFTATGAPGCVPGAFTTPRTLFVTPIPSTPCEIALNSTYPLGTGSRLRFRQWSDAFLPAVPRLSFDGPDFPTESLSFTALYTTQHQVLTSVKPAGSGSIAPASGQFFDEGSSVQLTATPAACFALAAWSSNAPNGLVTMAAPQQVAARFVGNSASALNVTIAAGPMTNIGVGRYRQTLTIRNNGAAVTDARLVINNLTAGFSVPNANGTTTCSSTGRPFLNIPPPFGQQSVTIDFFRLGAAPPPTYTPSVIANGQP